MQGSDKKLARPLLIIFITLISFTLYGQDFLPKLNQVKSLERDTSNFYFKEIWILSKDVNADDVGGFLRRASDKIDLGYFNEALTDIDKSISLDSTIGYSYYLKGFLLYKKDSLTMALSNFKKAESLNDTNIYLYLFSADIYARQEQFADADSLYKKTININKDFSDGYFGLGNLNFMTGNIEKAEFYYKKVIELNPEFPIVYFNLALLTLKDDPYKAIRYLNKTIELDPQAAHAFFFRAYAEIMLKRLSSGFEDLGKAVELQPLNLFYRMVRGLTYIGNKQYKEGFPDLIKVLETSKVKNRMIYFSGSATEQLVNDFLSQILTFNSYSDKLSEDEKEKIINAICLFYLRKHNMADRIYEKLLENTKHPGLIYYLQGFNNEYFSSPKSVLLSYKNAVSEKDCPVEAYFRQGIRFNSLGKDAEAIRSLSVYINSDDSTKLAFFARGNSYVNVSKFDSAIYDFNHYISLDSTFLTIYFNRAMCFKNLGDNIKALEDYSFIVRNDSSDLKSVGFLSECKYLSGDTIGALTLLNHTLKKYRRLSETGYKVLGTINLSQKYYDAAIAYFSDAISSNPNYTEALVFRGLAYYCIRDYVKARTDLTAALLLDKEDQTALYTRGMVNLMLKDLNGAYFDLQKADSLGHPLAKKAINIYLRHYKPVENQK